MSLLLGLHVYSTLSSATAVTARVGDRIYPHGAEDGVNDTSWVTFGCDLVDAQYTKDGHAYDRHEVTIKCVSPTYEGALELAQAVRDALDGNLYEYEGWKVTDSTLASGHESFDTQRYCVELAFEMETEDDV